MDDQPVAKINCPSEVWVGCYTPDGKSVVIGGKGNENNLQVWDVATQTVTHTLRGHSRTVHDVAVAANGRLVVSASDDKTIRVWNTNTGKLLATVKSAAHRVVVTSDSCYIVFCGTSTDNKVHICRIARKVTLSGEVRELKGQVNISKVRTLEGHTSDVNAVAVSKDVQYVVSGSCDNTVRLWEFDSGRCLHTFKGHTWFIWSVAISSDKQHVFSCSSDKTIRVWSTQSGELVRTLEGHTGSIVNIKLFPCDRYLVSASNDCTTRVWDWRTGTELQSFASSQSSQFVSISCDGNIASRSETKTVSLWKLTNPATTTTTTTTTSPSSTLTAANKQPPSLQEKTDPQVMPHVYQKTMEATAETLSLYTTIEDWKRRKEAVEALTEHIQTLKPGTFGFGSKVGERFHTAVTLQAQAVALKKLLEELLVYLEPIPQQSVTLLQDNFREVEDELDDLQHDITVQNATLERCVKRLARSDLTQERETATKSQQAQVLGEMRALRKSIKLLRQERLQTFHHFRFVASQLNLELSDANTNSYNTYGQLAEQLSVSEVDISELTNIRRITQVHAQTPIHQATYQASREVVLKTFYMNHPAQSQAFFRELEIRIKVIRHDNILPVIGIVYDPTDFNILYLMLPWCEFTLDQWVQTTKPSFAAKYSVMTQIMSGVEHLHSQGVVHKDLKPSNILVDSNNHVQVTDFGHSKEVLMQAPSQQTTVLVGTKAFRDPVLEDGRHATFDSDMYSLGLCIYSMFFPYGGEGKSNAHPHSIPHHPKRPLVDVLEALMFRDHNTRPTLLVSIATATKPLLSSFPLFTSFVTDLDADLTHLMGPRDAVWKLTEDEAALPWKTGQGDGIGRIKLNRNNGMSWTESKNDIIKRYVAVEVFKQQGIPSTLKSVTMVRKVESQAAFMEKIRTLSYRYTNLASIIDIEKSLRTSTVQYIDKHYGLLPCSSYSKVQLRQAYHGVPSLEVAEAIMQGGFMVRCKTDDGWYGRGIYLAMDIDYARYYGQYVIVCNVVSGNIFEVTSRSSHCNGKSVEPDYDTHAVVVNHSKVGLPQPIPTNLSQPPSTPHPRLSAELVVAEASQILPRCILDFSSTHQETAQNNLDTLRTSSTHQETAQNNLDTLRTIV